MHKLDSSYVTHLFKGAINLANQKGRPLFLLVVATKPCYIKLASLAFALEKKGVPFLLVDTGQHFDPVLTGAKEELNYQHLICVNLRIKGDLLERTADLAHKIRWLAQELRAGGLREPSIPIVSGDTSSAALFPIFWYLQTGCRSVHVEAGLRSFGPEIEWRWQGGEQLLSQRSLRWVRFRDEPFPESIDTTLASVASDLLLAPVSRNADNLITEGYAPDKIQLVGSLSADAVELATAGGSQNSNTGISSELSHGSWLRVDIHRRENTTPERLRAILLGIASFSERGGRVVLVMTNALRSAIRQHGMTNLLPQLEHRGVLIQDLWPCYLDVIHFMRSSNCLAVFTDSGGLQEEANILGVPCITCRYSTDRPETVLDSASNLLLPPVNEEFVSKGLEEILTSRLSRQVWPNSPPRKLYGENVGDRIAELLSEYTTPPPAKGSHAFLDL